MNNQKIKLAFEACAEYKGKLWFTAFNHNGLYFRNINSADTEAVFAGIIPEEEKYAFRLYSSVKAINDKIVLIPFEAKDIAVYDINEKSFEKIALKSAKSFSSCYAAMDMHKFWCSAVCGDFVYMFSHNYPAVVKLNTIDMKVTYLLDVAEIIDKKRINNDCYLSDIYIENDFAYFSCASANIWLKFSFKDESWEAFDINYVGKGYNGILKYKNKIWLAPRYNQSPLLSIDIHNHLVKSYSNYPDEFYAPAVPFHTIYQYCNKLILVPAMGNQFVIFDIDKEIMFNWECASEILKNRDMDCFSYDIILFNTMDEHKLNFISGLDYNMYTIFLENNELKTENLSIISDYPCISKLASGAFSVSENKTLGESKAINLSLLLSSLDVKSELNSDCMKSKESIGDKIHEHIKFSI